MNNAICVIAVTIVILFIIAFICYCIARIVYKNIINNSIRAHKEWIDQQEKEFEKYKQ